LIAYIQVRVSFLKIQGCGRFSPSHLLHEKSQQSSWIDSLRGGEMNANKGEVSEINIQE
jgi:hypothetical protein